VRSPETSIASHNRMLYWAYLLKEQLRLVFQHRGAEVVALLDTWLAWARRSRIPAFVEPPLPGRNQAA
jgi:hypothetical protein